MRPSVKKKEHTSFAGDVLKLVTGTAAAQGLTIITMPMLTRLYDPGAFGTLALFVSIITIISHISCLRYELSINLPKCDKEAANLLGLSVGIAIVTSMLMVPIFWFGQSTIAALLKAPGIRPYLWLAPPTMLFSGIFLALNAWNSRTRHYGRLSLAKFLKSFTTVSGKLGAGYAGYTTTAAGLIGSSFAGAAFSSLALGYTVWHEDSSFLRKSISWTAVKVGFKRYLKFPLYNTWTALLNSISWQLPVLMLGIFFSQQVVGYYALSYRLISIPMSLIGTSISQVYFQRASEAYSSGPISNIVENFFYYLVFIAFLPACILLLTGEDIFRVFFGPSWAESGIYVQILAVWLFAWFVSSPISTTLAILERQDLSLGVQSMIFGSRFLSLWIGGVVGEPRIAIAIFSISGFFLYGYLSLLALDISGVSIKKSLKVIFDSFIFNLPGVAILVVFKFVILSSVAIVFADIILIILYAYLVKTLIKKKTLFDYEYNNIIN